MDKAEVERPRPRVLLNDRPYADRQLRALLADEASFLPRVPTLLRQLKLKAKQIVSRYSFEAYTAEEVRVMKVQAIAAAMVPSREELQAMAMLQGNMVRETIKQFNAFLDGVKYSPLERVKARVKSHIPG